MLHLDQGIDDGLPIPESVTQVAPTPIPCPYEFSKWNSFTGQLRADRPAQKSSIKEDPDLRHVSRIESQGHRFPDKRRQRRRAVPKAMEVDAVDANQPRLRDVNEKHVQLLE